MFAIVGDDTQSDTGDESRNRSEEEQNGSEDRDSFRDPPEAGGQEEPHHEGRDRVARSGCLPRLHQQTEEDSQEQCEHQDIEVLDVRKRPREDEAAGGQNHCPQRKDLIGAHYVTSPPLLPEVARSRVQGLYGYQPVLSRAA